MYISIFLTNVTHIIRDTDFPLFCSKMPYSAGSQGWENATDAKGEKQCNRYQSYQRRENMQPVPRAGKYATGAKGGKTCNWCQGRENMQPVPSKRNAQRRSDLIFTIGVYHYQPCNRITKTSLVSTVNCKALG